MTVVSARRLLAGLWILDGLLQLLPRMFTMFMVQSVLRPPVVGEPDWLAHLTQSILVTGSQHLLLFNGALAAIQVALGLALLWRGGSARWPHWLSLIWCAAVWVFGEAFAGMLTGQGTLVTGAPGSVVLYALLTWAAWPVTQVKAVDRRRRWLTLALAAVWALGACLQAAPAFWGAQGLSQMLLGNANSYQPAWFNAWMAWGGAALAAHPVAINALLIAAMAMIAAGTCVPGRPRRIALAASIAGAAVMWVFGQAFGMLLMAMTTDPNSAPLLVMLALYAWRGADAQPREGATSLMRA